jgi:hypothetical protein
LGKEKIVSRRHHGQGAMDADSSTPSCGCSADLGNGNNPHHLRHAYFHFFAARLPHL